MSKYLKILIIFILLILNLIESFGQNDLKKDNYVLYNSIGFLPGVFYKRDFSSQQLKKGEVVYNYSLDQFLLSNSKEIFLKIRLDISDRNYQKDMEIYSLLLMTSLYTKLRHRNFFIPPLFGYMIYDNGFKHQSGGIGLFNNSQISKSFRNSKIELMAKIFTSVNPLNWHEKQMKIAPGIILFPQLLIRYRNFHINLELFGSYSYGINNSKKYYRMYPRIQVGYSLFCSSCKQKND